MTYAIAITIAILGAIYGYCFGRAAKIKKYERKLDEVYDRLSQALQNYTRAKNYYPIRAYADNGVVYVTKPKCVALDDGFAEMDIVVAEIPYDPEHPDYAERTAKEIAEKINYELNKR